MVSAHFDKAEQGKSKIFSVRDKHEDKEQVLEIHVCMREKVVV